MTVALERFANAVQTTLSAAMTNVQTTASVASSSGFPTQVTAPIQYRVLVDSEIMVVTAGFGTTTWTVTRGVEGTSAAAHSSGAAVTHIITDGALQRWAPNYAWLPWQNGLVMGTVDPLLATSAQKYATGFIVLTKMWVPETVAVSNLLIAVTVAGATLTAGQNLVGLYSPAGAVLCQTADQSTAWTTTGTKTMAVTGAPVTITGGPDVWVWGAFLANGTTAPTFAATPTRAAGGPDLNIGLPGNAAATTVGSTSVRMGAESVGARTSLISLAALQVTPYANIPLPWMAAS